MGREHRTEADEGPHDLDAHVDGARAVEHRRETSPRRAPPAVNAVGRAWAPTCEIPDCDLKIATSSVVSWNMKSGGNRAALRLIA